MILVIKIVYDYKQLLVNLPLLLRIIVNQYPLAEDY